MGHHSFYTHGPGMSLCVCGKHTGDAHGTNTLDGCTTHGLSLAWAAVCGVVRPSLLKQLSDSHRTGEDAPAGKRERRGETLKKNDESGLYYYINEFHQFLKETVQSRSGH